MKPKEDVWAKPYQFRNERSVPLPRLNPNKEENDRGQPNIRCPVASSRRNPWAWHPHQNYKLPFFTGAIPTTEWHLRDGYWLKNRLSVPYLMTSDKGRLISLLSSMEVDGKNASVTLNLCGQQWRKISSRLIKSQATRLLKHQAGGESYYRGRSHTQTCLTQGDRRETRETEMIYEPQVRAAWSWCKLIRTTPKHVGWNARITGKKSRNPGL